MSKILVLNGPNLGRLGVRQPEIYGTQNLVDLERRLRAELPTGYELELRQTDDEAELVGWLHEAVDTQANVVLNPAAFTHYSYALRDAVAMVTESGQTVIEVHISNPHAREQFRHNSVISAVATGVIAGFGFDSYSLALKHICQ